MLPSEKKKAEKLSLTSYFVLCRAFLLLIGSAEKIIIKGLKSSSHFLFCSCFCFCSACPALWRRCRGMCAAWACRLIIKSGDCLVSSQWLVLHTRIDEFWVAVEKFICRCGEAAERYWAGVGAKKRLKWNTKQPQRSRSTRYLLWCGRVNPVKWRRVFSLIVMQNKRQDKSVKNRMEQT